MKRGMTGDRIKQMGRIDAIALVQGRMVEMVSAADIAEKAAGVIAKDIQGNCPQSMLMLAILGDTASVEMAVKEIKENEMEARKNGSGKIN